MSRQPTNLLLYNPQSGNRSAVALTGVLRAALEAHYGTFAVEATRGPASAAGQVQNAIAAGVRRVIVMGGDGTIHDALQGLAGSNAEMGILPLGTGNVLARDMGLSPNPLRAVRQLVELEPRTVPVGICEMEGREQYFLASAGAGSHAEVLTLPKQAGGGRLHYYQHGLRLMLAAGNSVLRLQITTAEGKEVVAETSEVLITRVRSYGGMMRRWQPGSSLVDSKFAVSFPTHRGPLQMLAWIASAAVGKPNGRWVATLQATGIAASLVQGCTNLQLDGEVHGGTSFMVTAKPAALRLLLPKRYRS